MPSIAFSEPDMSHNDSSDESIRKLTDDYGRHRLADLMEADENEEDGLEKLRSPSRRKRYSSIGSTASSTDGLWESHPRRLSEAGLSRHSDSSAILTEDTDSFMIGQRVWVGGTKPGTIAYIGETQFAPGEWAGIALDEPIGKNDGSVAGIRYFQCENKKGVFSRLTRLTRVPLEQPGMGSSETCTSPNGVRRSPISPTGSTSLLKSPTLTNSNTSLSSAHVDFKIGDRVIIKSTQGSKVGTVRYMGLTDFAPGEWVGVELDDPRGKNDGSVEGKRYFECRPHFGLFAPIHKVSKSPSKVKPGACVVHSGLPPSGLKRTNSKESMTSMTSKTSAASSVRRVRLGVTSLTPKKVQPKTSTTPIPTRTALQDVLREKQQHIEQLLKERDLERAEITRAASQADEAEQRFFNLKQEFEQYRSECELKVRESSDLLARLKVDREELLSQLEDEKRKNEDLQFRFEEAAITKNDIAEDILVQSATNETHVKKIKQLEEKLAEERTKAENAEIISNKLFEAEESLIKAREEIEGLRSELETMKKLKETMESEQSGSKEFINSLQNQMQEVTSKIKEKEKEINVLNENYAKLNSEHEVAKRESEENCAKKDSEIETLKKQLAERDELLKEKSQMVETLEKQINELSKENDKLKMDLSAKSLDLETTTEKLSAKEEEMKSAQNKFEEEKQRLNQIISDLENSKVGEDNQRKQLDQTREELTSKISELDRVKRELHEQLQEKDKKLEEANKTASEAKETIEKLHSELSETKNKFEEHKTDIHSRHARQIEERDSQLVKLAAQIQEKTEEIAKNSIVITKLEGDLCAKNAIIEKLYLEIESLKHQHLTFTTESTVMTRKMQELELSRGDLQRELSAALERIASLTEAKQNLEVEVQRLIATSGQENALQLEQLTRDFQAKEQAMEMAQRELGEKLQATERTRHEIELRYQQLEVEFAKLREEYEEKLRVVSQSEALLKERCDNSMEEASKVREEYRMKIAELEQVLHEKNLLLTNLQNKLVQVEGDSQQRINMITEESTQNIQMHQQKIEVLTAEISQLKEQLIGKSEEIAELNAKYGQISVQCQQTENELQQKFTERIKTLEYELQEKTTQLETKSQELVLLKTDCQNVNVDLTEKNQRISQLVSEMETARQLITKLETELNAAKLEEQKIVQEQAQRESQCKNLLDQVAMLTEKVQQGELVFQNLQMEHNNVLHLMKRLKITEQQKQQCLEQIQIEVGEERNCTQIMNLLNQVQITNNYNAEKMTMLQQELDLAKNKLEESAKQFEYQKNEILHLQNELLKAQEMNARVPNSQGDQISLIQDKELAENQIKFLNSIIVDIQRKNEEQKQRIAILESGYSPAAADELNEMGLPGQRQIPPRVYCDICEEFDLHETEDCPQQNTDVAPPLSRERRQVEERPYCEICEAFGHATEDCQEDQTF